MRSPSAHGTLRSMAHSRRDTLRLRRELSLFAAQGRGDRDECGASLVYSARVMDAYTAKTAETNRDR